ncbi:hypothetical protein AVEN_98154-1 [Araneus ventricosus]|uniref:RNase H type-1 domain-containing protein n=1 Tax=Araneus ventricosus TaxID=182803 RepID=A0A4Y2UUL6_ARAVE|nr:hypothetical protein AVEN_98154-1 [Araneus ventricosus]
MKLVSLSEHLPDATYEAELAAIQFAANWAVSENSKINLYTDSLSSILALQSASSRTNFVNKAKTDLFKAKNLVGLSWVKAHVGIQGNELADQQAKLATITGEELSIPAPRSYLTRTLKQLILHEWCGYWNKYTSASGIRVRGFLDTVSPNFLIYNKILIYFLSGHGPFPFYLHRFKRVNSPLCTCGLVGDADHFFYCSLTREFHLIKPTEASKKLWFKNLMSNKQAIGKMTNSSKISNDISTSGEYSPGRVTQGVKATPCTSLL